MNRQIIFRGKRLDNGEWVYGDLEYNSAKNIVRIHTYDNNGEYLMQHLVQPDAVGQFTGLTDKNGKEIYEGDILSTDLAIPRCEVVFRNGCFALRLNDGDEDFYDIISPIDESVDKTKYHNIIGSIHDNPDLLNGK